MKKLSLVLILSALNLQTAFAKSPSSVKIDPQTLRSLPAVSALGVTVNPGPVFADVQPTALIHFKYSSCATQLFQSKSFQKEGVLFVSLVLPELAIDCMGPQIQRDYTVQLTSNFLNQAVVVLNPVELSIAQ